MICSDEKLDSHRFKDIIDDAISQGFNLFNEVLFRGPLKFEMNNLLSHQNLEMWNLLQVKTNHLFPGVEGGSVSFL
jgi:hypothetical protein